MRYLLLFSILISHSLSAITWSSASYLSTEGQNAISPILKMSPSTGRAIAGWIAIINAKGVVQVSLFDGSNWSAPASLSDTDYNCSQPDFSINSLGRMMAVWRKYVSATSYIIEASFYNGSSWSSPTTLSSGSYASYPAIAMDPLESKAIALWRNSNGNGTLSSAYFNGSTWSDIGSFSPSSSVGENNLVINQNEVAIAGWISPDTTRSLGLSTYSGSWSDAPSISGANSGVIDLDLTIDPSANNGAAIWSDFNAIQVATWDGSSWSSATALLESQDFVLETSLTYNSANDNIAAIWRGNNGVMASIYDTSSWSDPITVASAGMSPKGCYDPSNNNLCLIWQGTSSIQYSEYNGDSLSDAADLSATNTSVKYPSISIDNSGNALAIWQITIDGYTRIEASRGSAE